MKFNKIFSLCLSILMLGACHKGAEDKQPIASEFKLASSVLAVRAPELDADGAGHFMDGDRNSVFIHGISQKSLLQLTYIYGGKYYWEDFNLPEGTKTCKVSACYPEVTTSTPENFSWNIQEQSDMTDFLLAAPADADPRSSAPVKLSFSHALHRLTVILQSKAPTITEEALSQAIITCRQLLPVAHLNLLEGKAIEASGDPISLSGKGKEVSFILPGQPTGKIEIVLRLGKHEKVIDLSSCKVDGQPLTKLEAGKSFMLNIGVDEEHIFILNQGINGWGDQGSANDTIII